MTGSRRNVLRLGALAAVWLAAGAHTPYRQWTVYRRKHLLLLAHRDDPETYEVATALAETLQARLPESKARVTRAPHLHRVASLLATGQLDFAVLRLEDALTMLHGDAPLDPYGKIPLTGVAAFGGRVLVARADVPDEHGWLLARALNSGAGAFGALPPHPGVLAYAQGEAIPESSEHAHE